MHQYIMILGAGLMQEPAIKSAGELGYKTLVADANPDAPSVKLADIFAPVDLKDRDALVKLADDLIRKEGEGAIRAVFTAGTDFSANAAYVCEHLGLKSHTYEACLNASDKVRMRKCFAKENVPSPDFCQIQEEDLESLIQKAEEGKIEFPKVIKPVDNMGGRGCRLVRNSDELETAVKTAISSSRTKRAIFEDYMEGAEFSIDSVVYNGTLTITGFADRHIYYPPYFIETGHTMPSAVSPEVKSELISVFALGIKALGLTHGVAKADIKYTKNGPMIGEIAARLSGGYMSGWTYPYSSDLNLTKQALCLALGKEPEELLKNRHPLQFTLPSHLAGTEQPFELFEYDSTKTSAERAWLSIPGVIKSVEGLESLKNFASLKDILPRKFAGDTVSFPRNNVQKCGNVISLDKDYDKAVQTAEDAAASITLRLEPHNQETQDFIDGICTKDEKGFPPSAFNIQLDEADLKDVPAGKRAQDYIPSRIESNLDSLKDWNHCSLRLAIQKFDELCPDHPALDGKTFWRACVRASVQGMLYVADCLAE